VSSWTCPHCNRLQTVTSSKVEFIENHLGNSSSTKFNGAGYRIITIECANTLCGKLTVKLFAGARLTNSYGNRWVFVDENWLFDGQVYPSPKGKPQPSYIPSAVVSDYHEACLIKDLSPKASAALARRAVQGIIRDFAGISKNTLALEINELRKRVEERTADQGVTMEIVDAIDNIRSVGNIGAHMEKDVNLIIDVEPDEAALMIELIEDMFEDLYVARHHRQERAARMKQITAEKSAARKANPVLLSPPEEPN
jgi:Domain of unknown function (DUF4145)